MLTRRNAALVALAPLMVALACQQARADDAAAEAAGEVSGVTVIGQRDDAYRAKNTATATKTDTPLRDVPQAVTVITDELIRDQAMQTMADVVRYVPGVTMGQGEGHRDAPTIRGNATTADFFVDGVRDDVQYFRDLYNVERVEVLKGPNAMIFGRGGGGGVINRVMKKADWSTERSATVELGSWDHRRFTTDLGQPLLGEAIAGRVAAMYERSDSFRDFVNVERWGVNPSIAWRDDTGLTVSLTYEHFEDDRTTDRGIPSFAGRPSPAPRSAFFGDPERSYARTNVDLVNVGVEYAVSEALTIRNRTLYGDYDKYYANIFPGGAAAAGPTGAPATYPLQAYQNDSPRENLFNQTDLIWKTEFGGMQHTVLAGVELGRQKTTNLRRTGHFNTPTGSTTLAGQPFADPTRRGLPIFFTTTGGDANNRVKATVAAVYLQDQVEITEQLQLVAGLRFDSFDVDVFDRRASATRRDFSRQDDLWSPRVGLVFKPIEPVSLYASYSVSYLPSSGDQFASLSATSETLEPEEFENLEVGLKWEITPELQLTAALYRLDRENTTAPDPTRPGQVVLTGSQRTEGFEAGLSGRITPQWEISGGYAWQDAEITGATSAAPAGREVPLVPEHTFSLWNRYDLNDRFGLGLGVIRQGKMFASLSNAVTLPGFTRVDAAVFVRLTDTIRAQINVENLFDKRYFPTSHGDNNILPGAPRAVRASLSADF